MSGYFGQEAQYSTGSGDFEPAEAGVYVCKFKEIEKFQEGSFDDKTIMVDKFRFRFESTDPEDVNQKGEPFRFSVKTGRKYGNDRAGLTQLLDSMIGRRLTADEFQQLDLDTLRARNYSVTVDAKPGTDGRIWNNVQSVVPVRRRQAPPQGQTAPNSPPQPPAQQKRKPMGDEDFSDPFDE